MFKEPWSHPKVWGVPNRWRKDMRSELQGSSQLPVALALSGCIVPSYIIEEGPDIDMPITYAHSKPEKCAE